MTKFFMTILLLLLFVAPANSSAQTCMSNADIPATTPTSLFTDHGDGTTSDTTTGLMWARCPEGLSGSSCTVGSAIVYTWGEALSHVKGSALAGYSDWRLPNIKELRSLVEEQCSYPSINLAVFPSTPSAAFFWSASPTLTDMNLSFGVHFIDGIPGASDRWTPHYVRLVRSVQ